MEPNVSRYINFMLLLSPSYVSSLYSLDHIWSLFSDTRIFVANFYWLLGSRIQRIHFISELYNFWECSERTRLTVGRVKPLLDLHRLCVLDAIKWSHIRFGLGDNSQFQRVYAYIIISELGTPHWHPTVLGYSSSKSGGWLITFFLNL